MILFFKTQQNSVIASELAQPLKQEDKDKLSWLYGQAQEIPQDRLEGWYVGPRREMITPWSTNAVEITLNMGLKGISRIEEYFPVSGPDAQHDEMLQRMYRGLDQDIFRVDIQPQPIHHIEDLDAYNEQEGLALSKEEIEYLKKVEKDCGRPLTDSEVFGFAQINSEHCRHKIFGGCFIIDGQERPSSLFQLIKKTTKEHPGRIISAYKDNVAFARGPVIEQFAPLDHSKPDYYQKKDIECVISLKAETHNFPTTVEPFNGASTGSGGEIRDRMGGGKGSWPLAGTAVYMTSYTHHEENQREWEELIPARKWLYQTPEQILIKASNGASDFGNKFGQPLICGSLLTFEHKEGDEVYGYDKVIMLAGGVGYGTRRDCLKGEPQAGNKIVVLGGDNYRIGLGGGSVSSVDTGRYTSGIELNAVQRANAEMQKRTYNVVRALCEEDTNPVVSIHDHGAAGHVNCLSELVEDCGGKIQMKELPIGDRTLSSKEIIANESQERMGLLIQEESLEHVRQIAERERAPMYLVGETTGDHRFCFEQEDGVRPFDLAVSQMFGSSPRTYMVDKTKERHYAMAEYTSSHIEDYLVKVLQLEAVACKDWLTNKVDRCVTGRIARQQCQGEIQLPLSDCGVVALDYRGKRGIATALGHAPQVALADPKAGSIDAVTEALTNIVWAPLEESLDGVSLSANWMWPCRSQEGEDARLYEAVQALSDFCIELGVNVPTGKDSLSMTQKYPSGEKVIAPGTVIVSAGAEVEDVRKVVSPVLRNDQDTTIYHIDLSFDRLRLGGSALFQTMGKVGDDVPMTRSAEYFRDGFNAIQELVRHELILSGHDISAGGLLTTLLEMCFGNEEGGMEICLDGIREPDLVKVLFAENAGVVIQVQNRDCQKVEDLLRSAGVAFQAIGHPSEERQILVEKDGAEYLFGIDYLRDVWYHTSYLLDSRQCQAGKASERYLNYKMQPIRYDLKDFKGTFESLGLDPGRREMTGIRAAVIREKGTNSEREMAYVMHLAGFDVRDVMMTDLVSGRETLEDVNLIVFCGGFSNSDVLGSAKGWAGAFLYNEKARKTLERYYEREDTLSLGVCNGCQLMMWLGLTNDDHRPGKDYMDHNESHKFECGFIGVTIPRNHSVMFSSLEGMTLGIWAAHGEGRFMLSGKEEDYHIVARYSYGTYPGNPNGSAYNVAGIASSNGRHVAIMPHPERCYMPWQCAYYPSDRLKDDLTPWAECFVNARRWIEQKKRN